jgi:hypothetical protein
MTDTVVITEVDAVTHVVISRVKTHVRSGEFSWYHRMYNVIVKVLHKLR